MTTDHADFVTKDYTKIAKYRDSNSESFQRKGNTYKIEQLEDNEEIHIQTFYRKGKVTATIMAHYINTGELTEFPNGLTIPKLDFVIAYIYLKRRKQNKLSTMEIM